MEKVPESKRRVGKDDEDGENFFKRIFGSLKRRNSNDEVAEVKNEVASEKYQPDEEMIRKLEVIQRKMYQDQMRMRRKTIERYNRTRTSSTSEMAAGNLT